MKNLQDLLTCVRKPTRYLGNEWNAVKKDLTVDLLRFALIYPDLYEIGMSHLGSRILYEIINEREDVVCERAFAPAPDMEEMLINKNLPLTSIESNFPLNKFHVLGFTLQYELTYTNILTILNLSKIPLFSKDRLSNHPIIIGGGPCAFNPEPIAAFFDCFILGEGEEVVLEALDSVNSWRKEKKQDRFELLYRLSQIPGIYVPSFYDVSYNSDGTINAISPNTNNVAPIVVKRLIKDLDLFPYPKRPIVPFTEVVHDKMALELFRGCTRGCRFCQAGAIYRPVRERSQEILKELLQKQSSNTGFNEVALASLSSADYTGLEEFISSISGFCEYKNISVSLPSTRVDNFPLKLAQQLEGIHPSGLTLAPEAGSERLRKLINKPITCLDLINTITNALSMGWQTIKLYFMIGLPEETFADLDETCSMIREVKHSVQSNRFMQNKRFKLNITISSFVPKSHTPFQWVSQDVVKVLDEKSRYLAIHMPKKDVQIKWHNPQQSHIEAVLARGDRNLAIAIFRAWKLGARLDEWGETFKYVTWEAAFKNTGINPEFYANRERSLTEIFPWNHLSPGLSKEWLIKEYQNAFKLESLHDCRWNPCYKCGVCQPLKVHVKRAKPDSAPIDVPIDVNENGKMDEILQITKYIVTFKKSEDVKFISHLDILRTFERSMRRSNIPFATTKGYHKRPKISIAAPLPVGISSNVELLEVELTKSIHPDELIQSINKSLSSGLEWLNARVAPLNGYSLMSLVKGAKYIVSASIACNFVDYDKDLDLSDLQNHLNKILNKQELLLPANNGIKKNGMDGNVAKREGNVAKREGNVAKRDGNVIERIGRKWKSSTKNVKPFIMNVGITDAAFESRKNGKVTFIMELATGTTGGVKPQDVLAVLSINNWQFTFDSAFRSALYLREPFSQQQSFPMPIKEAAYVKELAPVNGERNSCKYRRVGGQSCNP